MTRELLHRTNHIPVFWRYMMSKLAPYLAMLCVFTLASHVCASVLQCPSTLEIFESFQQPTEGEHSRILAMPSGDKVFTTGVPVLSITKQMLRSATFDRSVVLPSPNNGGKRETYVAELILTNEAGTTFADKTHSSSDRSLFVASIDGKSVLGIVQFTGPFARSIEILGRPYLWVTLKSLEDATLIERCFGNNSSEGSKG